jgi:hypothetical protein
MTEKAAGWCSPNALDILVNNIPDGSSWHELRLPLRTLSYPIEKWDEAPYPHLGRNS